MCELSGTSMREGVCECRIYVMMRGRTLTNDQLSSQRRLPQSLLTVPNTKCEFNVPCRKSADPEVRGVTRRVVRSWYSCYTPPPFLSPVLGELRVLSMASRSFLRASSGQIAIATIACGEALRNACFGAPPATLRSSQIRIPRSSPALPDPSSRNPRSFPDTLRTCFSLGVGGSGETTTNSCQHDLLRQLVCLVDNWHNSWGTIKLPLVDKVPETTGTP